MTISPEELKSIRDDYGDLQLDIADLFESPIQQFEKWFSEALEAEIKEPNAMALATVNEDSPRARYVLFKGLEGEGLIFHTNYQSSKAQEIKSNNEVAVVFYWREIHRQIRVEGIAEKAPKQISDSYFDTRPRGGQLSALASPQSKVIKSRKEIEKKIDKLDRKYGSKQINRPENWGGYIIQPIAWEFWQGRKNRTHDRFRYQRISSKWKIYRLAP